MFIVVAIVIFGIFVGLSYTAFGSEGLTNDLKNIFENALEQSDAKLTRNRKLVYSSDKELNKDTDEYKGGLGQQEFIWIGVDLTPIVEEHGVGDYIFEFDIKSEKEGIVQIYTQNGTSAKYGFGVYKFNTTLDYNHIQTKVTVIKFTDEEPMQSQVAIFGGYGSGIISTVKNVRVYKVLN